MIWPLSTGLALAALLCSSGCSEKIPPNPSASGQGFSGEGTTGADSDVTAGSTSASDGRGSEGTAGDGGGDLGAWPVPDPRGDVWKTSADVTGVAAYTDGEFIDLRAEFVAMPFDRTSTFSAAWCLDLDGSGADGSCTQPLDEPYSYITAYAGEVGTGLVGALRISHGRVETLPDPCVHAGYAPDTRTLRVLLPVEQVGRQGPARFVYRTTFGGSGGNNERAPDSGAADVIEVDELPAYGGDSVCF